MYIQIDDFQLFYKKTGHGQPLLLIHGNGEDCDIFDNATEILKDHFTVYAIDTRGHGRSGCHQKVYHYDQFCDDFLEFIEKLNLDDVVVFGFSDGAIIGALMALKSDKLAHCILCGINTDASQVSFSSGEFDFVKDADDNTKALFDLMLREPHISFEQLATIQTPVTFCFGENDIIPLSLAQEITSAVPNAKLHVEPNADHGSYIKRNVRVAELILQYAKEQK